MNIRNLETIHKILIEHANNAKDNYDNKSALKIWEGIYSDAEEALTDFEQENW